MTVYERIQSHIDYFGSEEAYHQAILNKLSAGVSLTDREAAEVYLSDRYGADRETISLMISHIYFFGGVESYKNVLIDKINKGVVLDDPLTALTFARIFYPDVLQNYRPVIIEHAKIRVMERERAYLEEIRFSPEMQEVVDKIDSLHPYALRMIEEFKKDGLDLFGIEDRYKRERRVFEEIYKEYHQ